MAETAQAAAAAVVADAVADMKESGELPLYSFVGAR